MEDEEHVQGMEQESPAVDSWAGTTTTTELDGLDGDGDRSPVVLEGNRVPDGAHALPFAVVGIGGSAGSLEALIEFFKNLPSETGMAFVVVVHLAAHMESHLCDIIGRHTRMRTEPVREGAVPERDHVYILLPNAQVRLEHGRFHLEPRTSQGAFVPVDLLFESLAREQKNYAIGIVLSGMDGDGAIGVRAIKGEGGFALVQSPETAKHPEMPWASISNDHVDMVLPPDLIARQVAGLARHFGDPGWRRFEQGERTENEDRIFGRILRLLKSVSGIDFRLYKSTTIRRRIARRMLMHKIETIADYMSYLQGNGMELRDLQEDILINVTRFFRDPEVFETLKATVIPQIVENRAPDQQIRLWVPACSSGEEVYSLAMLLLEHLTGRTVEPNIQIFGTDASELNIQKARVGLYPESIVNEVSPERLRRFFTKADKGYQVVKRVRDLCIFARQNLCTDPPFSRLDLVSCRNVLIYFGPELQARVILTFHYALRRDGFLLLGSSESIREFGNLFTLEDRTHKIFSRTGDVSSNLPLHTANAIQMREVMEEAPAPGTDLRREFDLSRLADRTILARYGPPGVVVNERMEIMQSRGRTTPFLELLPGMASLQLARMVRQGIASEVMAAVTRAIQDDLPVQVHGLRVPDGDQIREASMEVLPMHSVGTGSKYFLVVFLPHSGAFQITPALPQPTISVEEDPDRTIANLQHNLTSTKIYLQSLLDERDSKNQELVSANEEIQSANEELQSTNEELETTKEELQSSNEELQTVNEELSSRNTVLVQATNDLSNLLNNVNLPVVMLSNELQIRHFTPQTQRLMSVRPSDIGRPFGDIRLDLAIDNLETRMRQVLETLAPQEVEVQDTEGRWHLLTIRPYRTNDNRIEGLVLVMVDIDHQRRTQQQLRDARDFAASVIAKIPLPLVVVDSGLQIHSLNDAFCNLSGMALAALQRRPLTEVAAGLWNMEKPLRSLLEYLQENRDGESSFECEYRRSDESTRTLLVRGRPMQPDGERFMLVTFEDITAHKEVETLLKRESERLATQVAVTTQELDRSREELRALTDSLMTSQEDERRRVARELHDDVSQRMALLDMDCGVALQQMETAPETARQRLESLREHIGRISQDVRTLSHRLHPSMLDHLGVAAALESLLDEFARREGMLTNFFASSVPDHIPVEIATGLYRIAQEALRNVSKHAGRTHVKILLTGSQGSLHLQVADSGAGFDMNAQSSGLGFISMKERARLIGATLTVQSALHQGTRVDVHVPVPVNRIN